MSGHCIEIKYKGAIYRYYGWAHVKGATCVGEGDWRAVADGKEYQTIGVMVPAAVLREVVEELDHCEADSLDLEIFAVQP
jgi:hypothetical protein